MAVRTCDFYQPRSTLCCELSVGSGKACNNLENAIKPAAEVGDRGRGSGDVIDTWCLALAYSKTLELFSQHLVGNDVSKGPACAASASFHKRSCSASKAAAPAPWLGGETCACISQGSAVGMVALGPKLRYQGILIYI